jgi:hypothetical protein
MYYNPRGLLRLIFHSSMKEKLKESLDDILYVLCGDNTKNGVSRH